ncbi:MAG: ImmA/IrrE family metallo-endopeptidase [Candidatus Heimdallarchaeota archaeon]|nr:ImmA/IrrE family metallo-endopeptidase [Candidatus Heimdallarchaeota archaeon]
MLKKVRSIEVSVKREVFDYIIDYFGINEERLGKFKIKRNEDADDVITTASRLRDLSEFLKVPISIFFMNQPPPLPDLPKDYRSRTDQALTKNTINSIRDALWYQEVIYDLTGFVNKIETQALLDDDPKKIAKQMSKLISFEQLRNEAKKPEILLSKLKDKLEEFNIFVFTSKFEAEETRGFSLSEQEPPIIMITTKENHSARVFTVLHELGHIILKLPGISDTSNRVDPISPIEQWCDKFAEYIALPDGIIQFVDKDDYGDKINQLHNEILMSKFAIALKLLKLGQINQTEFNEYISRPYIRKVSSGGPAPHILIRSHKGKKFTSTVLDGYRNKLLTRSDILGIFNTNNSILDNLLDHY